MKITFHGAARNVTGSQHLLEINKKYLLLDCGLFQGKREETYHLNQNFAYDPAMLDAVILSHAHIDHSGNLPNLVKNGYEGPIYTNPVSSALVKVMLADSAYIQESDAEYLNKKKRGRGPLTIPLYTIADAEKAVRRLQKVKYNQPFEVLPGVRATLVEAGHILGSSSVVLDIEERGRNFRFWFSGDIGRRKLPLVRDPVLPKEAQFLLMECTYGDKLHDNPQVAYDKLRQAVSATIHRGGKVIIPAFAVGRTQDLVYELNQMIEDGEIPQIPVFVDSPLAVNISDIFRENESYFDDEAKEFMRKEKTHALSFDSLTYIRSVEASKALNYRDEPMVIISASGMVETGRILHHLKNNIGDPRNLILLVSYQAPYTLGRRLAEGQKQVRIFGDYYERKAQVLQLDGFSAHADQDFLVDYARSSRESLECLMLVHGDEDAAGALRKRLGTLGIEDVVYPELRETLEL